MQGTKVVCYPLKESSKVYERIEEYDRGRRIVFRPVEKMYQKDRNWIFKLLKKNLIRFITFISGVLLIIHLFKVN